MRSAVPQRLDGSEQLAIGASSELPIATMAADDWSQGTDDVKAINLRANSRERTAAHPRRGNAIWKTLPQHARVLHLLITLYRVSGAEPSRDIRPLFLSDEKIPYAGASFDAQTA
jgi:hypothetical protein